MQAQPSEPTGQPPWSTQRSERQVSPGSQLPIGVHAQPSEPGTQAPPELDAVESAPSLAVWAPVPSDPADPADPESLPLVKVPVPGA